MTTGSILLRYGCSHPVATLSALFLAWKSLLLLIILTSPGLGYDTSSSLLLSVGGKNENENAITGYLSGTPNQIESPWLKFVRWDAIYFTQMAEHGHVFEQEWAFGIGISSTIRWTAKIIGRTMDIGNLTASFMVAGVCLSHVAHWLAVLQIWAIASHLMGAGGGGSNRKSQRESSSEVPFLAAVMHIISPAGVFLSTPNTESLFACLSFCGFLAFLSATSQFHQGTVLRGACTMVASGLAFGLATLIRSNGILAGIPFLIEAVSIAFAVLSSQGVSLSRVVRLGSVVVGGLLVAAGMVLPQVLAYQEYCAGQSPGQRREWCEWTIPSIFTFVQSHYWNVGPFRYWTFSNLPLFLLAAPTLWILVQSAIEVMKKPEMVIRGKSPSSSSSSSPTGKGVTNTSTSKISSTNNNQHRLVVAASLALPQFSLAVLAFTSYHVQIITRISSGYPLWYIWLAAKIRSQETKNTSVAIIIIRWMIIYALVQAGLYASFLPPA
ncbi:ER membrane glycoprotein subunit of the GPI transamidase complex-like protein [Knufia peltigerae]|uniref:GPI mannosyltransferase 2 n=1 Tax=Knufia peltigerae TaxID=1002370 RepID=A0AA38Y902_9EURO|nr:ER membrane glycoprotein subunit of the GPI transamidase complex-like protein [Knufia peltigerae]